jgi:hypothetical protein
MGYVKNETAHYNEFPWQKKHSICFWSVLDTLSESPSACGEVVDSRLTWFFFLYSVTSGSISYLYQFATHSLSSMRTHHFPARIFLAFILCLFAALTFAGCGGFSNPVEKLQKELAAEKEYAIILNDMREEGNFVPSYYHQYRIDKGETKEVGPFVEVTEPFYKKNEPYLGMALATKTPDGKATNTPIPNGYQYVGNPEYGRWRQDESGGSMWEFYGKYMLMSQVMNWAGFGMNRNHYNNYATNLSGGRPYFGSNNQYGTNGSVTKTQKPDFYARKSAKMSQSQSRFKNKINQRVGRSKSSFRSRGMSFGK